MIKAVIFDMDGVLVDSEPYHIEAENIIYSKMGLNISDEEMNSFVGMAMDRLYDTLREKYHLTRTTEDFLAEDTEIRINAFKNKGKMTPIKGIPELLKDIKAAGLKIAVASSSHQDIIKIVLEASSIIDFFDFYLSSFDESVKHGKPEPDIYLKAASMLSEKPENCIVIEDSFNGVTAATKAGIKCIGYKNPASGNQDLSAATVIIDDYTKIDVTFIKSL